MPGKPEKDFVAEYAKSDRAGCKGCQNKIPKESLRIGKYIPSPHFDGYTPLWFHAKCFFEKKGNVIHTTADIQGFSDLKFDDQQFIKSKLSGGATAAPAAKESKTAAGEAEEGEFNIEYAKSNRSTCRKCSQKIEQGEIRVGQVEFMEDRPGIPVTKWCHPKCFAEAGNYTVVKASQINGFRSLTAEEQKEIKTLLGDTSGGDANGDAPKSASKGKGKKKRGDESEDEDKHDKKKGKTASKGKGKKGKNEDSDDDVPLIKEEKKPETLSRDDKAQKAHSDKLWAIREGLKGVGGSVMKRILDHNDVDSRGSDVTLAPRLADIMLHGVPEVCPKCSTGKPLSYHDGEYKCGHHVDEYSTCQYRAFEAKRTTFKMPEDIGDANVFLSKFKFSKVAIPASLVKNKLQDKAWIQDRQEQRSAFEQAKEDMKKVKEEEEQKRDPATALKECVICVHATKGQVLDKDGIKSKVVKAGGKFVASAAKDVTHIVSTQAAVDQGGAMIKAAVDRKLPVVTEEWLDKCVAAGRRVTETGCLLRGEAREEPGSKRKAENTAKIIIKGRGAVDPKSGLADVAHILEKGNSVYSATLNRTSLEDDHNSFYVLQIIQLDSGNKACHLFRRWGRIGSDQGGDKLEVMDMSECIRSFEKLFEEKTGNRWADRQSPTVFPGKFHIAELGIGRAEEEDKKAKKSKTNKIKSKLPPSVESLMMLLFDIDMMKRTMVEMEVDLDKMPLGNLSHDQIKKGFGVLTELQSIILDDSLNDFDKRQKVLGASNKFYTIIPQNFGSAGFLDRHLINTIEKLTDKIQLVENLLELEIAVSFGKEAASTAEELSEADINYRKLKTELKPVAKSSKEFKMVDTYLQNTHGKTHSNYKMKLLDLFEIEREGEAERYAQHKNDSNRQLLWHGSRLTNWVGILSQGLRIAPPEAPVTGYMFGKGVYFADMSSKSANYCFTSPSAPEGILMLSEVALGDMHELIKSNSNLPKGLPKGKMSTKGCGKNFPDPAGSITQDDGVVVPCGKGTEQYGMKSDLLYNEFIVYDVSQVKTKYLLRVNFDYTRK